MQPRTSVSRQYSQESDNNNNFNTACVNGPVTPQFVRPVMNQSASVAPTTYNSQANAATHQRMHMPGPVAPGMSSNFSHVRGQARQSNQQATYHGQSNPSLNLGSNAALLRHPPNHNQAYYTIISGSTQNGSVPPPNLPTQQNSVAMAPAQNQLSMPAIPFSHADGGYFSACYPSNTIITPFGGSYVQQAFMNSNHYQQMNYNPAIVAPQQPIPGSMAGGFAQMNIPGVSNSQQQALQPAQQPSAASSQSRPKKFLTITDPKTNENVLEDQINKAEMRTGQQQTPTSGVASRQSSVDQMQGASMTGIATGWQDSRTSDRSANATPLLETQHKMSGDSLSRERSPALQESFQQPSSAIVELHNTIAQLSVSTAAQQSSHLLQQSQPIAMDDSADAVTAAATTTPPPQTSSSISQTVKSSSTPPANAVSSAAEMSVVTNSNHLMEFGPSSTVSPGGAWNKKAQDIIGKPQFEFGFGNLNTSAEERPAEFGDSSFAAVPQSDVVPEDKVPESISSSVSTKQSSQRPPVDSQPTDVSTSTNSDRKNDKDMTIARDSSDAQQSKNASTLLSNGTEKMPHVSDVSTTDLSSAVNSTPGTPTVGDRQINFEQSMEEGEIRDASVIESEDRAPAEAEATSAAATMENLMKMVEKLKDLEDKEGRLRYTREFMTTAEVLVREVAELPNAKKPMFNTDGWSPENVRDVYERKKPQASQIKLDRDGKSRALPAMPQQRFDTSWMSTSSSNRKATYPGRSSDTGGVRDRDRDRDRDRNSQAGGRHAFVNRSSINRSAAVDLGRPADVQLKQAENAWKPSFLSKETNEDDDSETKKLFKDVRSVLNKITPQTYGELAEEFFKMEPRMNTPERAKGIVDIVFQKAVDEPHFCKMYSQLYAEMTKRQHQLNSSGTKGSTTAANRDTDFRWILLTKCQKEFEKEFRMEQEAEERKQQLDNAATPEEKKQLRDELEDMLKREKRRSLENMRFIGELYLRSMLTSRIMHRCIAQLMRRFETDFTDEESLECLCKLLSTIGKTLEEDKESDTMQAYFTKLQDLSQGLSNRIRFMILNLLDMRQNNWQPRRKNDAPKTLDEIHLEAKLEKAQIELNQQMHGNRSRSDFQGQPGQMNDFSMGGSRKGAGGRRSEISGRSSYGPNERLDHGGRDRNMGIGRDQKDRPGGRPLSNQQSTSDAKVKRPLLSDHNMDADNVKLGPPRRSWNIGAVGASASKASEQSATPKLTNRYEHLSGERRTGNSAPNSRDSSQTRSEDKRKAVESTSQQVGDSRRAHDAVDDRTDKRATEPRRGVTNQKPAKDEDCLRREAVDLLDELTLSNDYKEALLLLHYEENYVDRLIFYALNHALDKGPKQRQTLGKLIGLSYNGERHLNAIFRGLTQIVSHIIETDMACDVPKVWQYFGEMLADACIEVEQTGAKFSLLDFRDMFVASDVASVKILAQILHHVSLKSKEAAVRIWRTASKHLSELGIASATDVLNVLPEELEFLHGSVPDCINSETSNAAGASLQQRSAAYSSAKKDATSMSITACPEIVDLECTFRSVEEIDADKLIEFVEKSGCLSKADNDKSLSYIGALVKLLCSKIVQPGEGPDVIEIDKDEFTRCTKVLHRFVTGRPAREMKTLDTLAEASVNRGNPKGLLVDMLTVLRDGNVIPRETFREWWTQKQDEKVLSGIILTSGQVKAFFSPFFSDPTSDGGSESDPGE